MKLKSVNRKETVRYRPTQTLKWERQKWKLRVFAPRSTSARCLGVRRRSTNMRVAQTTVVGRNTIDIALSSFADSGLGSASIGFDDEINLLPQQPLTGVEHAHEVDQRNVLNPGLQETVVGRNTIDIALSSFADSGLGSASIGFDDEINLLPQQPLTGVEHAHEVDQRNVLNPGLQETDDRIADINFGNPPHSISTDVHIHNIWDHREQRNPIMTMCIDIRAENERRAERRACIAAIQTCSTCFQRPRQTVNLPCMCFCNCLDCAEVMVFCAVCQSSIEASTECSLQM